MKKQLAKLVAVGCASLLISTSALAADFLTVTTDNANVRTGASKDSPVSMELFQGYPLKIAKKKGEWYKISDYEQDTGWIHKSIVKKCDTVIVNAKNSINMRSGPTTKDSVVANVERGVVLTKLSTQGKWTKVRHSSGTVGWIYSPLLWP
jgi:SH3-like domain-containing protein